MPAKSTTRRPTAAPPDLAHNPIANVQWVPVEKVFANDYNPNQVAGVELRLLCISILADGWTQPVVTVRDEARDGWVVVDGFHRYSVMKRYHEIYEKNHGLLPIVVIDKPLNERMASTVRHNRARGKHSVGGMGDLVMQMLSNGWSDARVCAELGLEPEELARLKHVTGYAKLYADAEYSRAQETPRMIEARLKGSGEIPSPK